MNWLAGLLLAGGFEQFDYCLSEHHALQVAEIYAEHGEMQAFESMTYNGSLIGCFRQSIEGSKVRLVGKKRFATFGGREGSVHVE